MPFIPINFPPFSFFWERINFHLRSIKGLFGYHLLLEIENWKYCSKIIFKCVNSTMRPSFKVFCKKKKIKYLRITWTVPRTHQKMLGRATLMLDALSKRTVNPCAWTVRVIIHTRWKKNVNAELKTWIQTDTKYYLNSSDSLIIIMSINYIIVYS